jgi:hypothetical protein
MTSNPHDRRSERGVILPLLAVLMPALIGAIGLAVDTGAMYEMSRRMQSATDAAAIAAAQEIRASNESNATAAAKSDAALNGFDDAEDGVEVEVHRPPTMGPRAGDNAYVEVIVSQPSPLYFMSMFVNEQQTVRTRAVSALEPGEACVMALNETASSAVSAVGNVDVDLVGCALWVNSSDPTAARTTGSASVTADAVNVVGDYSGSGFSPTPSTGAAKQADPFEDMAMPSSTASCDYTKKSVKSVETLSPGVYCDGLTFTAKAEATLEPGLYVVKGGGIKVNGGAEIIGAGVTFYNTEGGGYSYDSITVNGGGTITLTAPTAGTYKGMLFMQDPAVSSSSENTFNGTADVTLTGVIYLPTTPVKVAGTFDAELSNVMLIADTIKFAGDASFSVLNDTYLPPALKYARLVE